MQAVTTLTVQEGLRWATHQLQGASHATARLEAELLMAHVLASTRTEVYLNPQRVLTETQSSTLQNLVERRCRGEPLQYLVKHTEFYGCSLMLTPAALIPRPETEELVEILITSYRHLAAPPAVLELGTGSGAIAIALARAWPTSAITAVDISHEALALARENARRNGVSERIRFLWSNWFSHVDGEFDLIVSNPPYVRTEYLDQHAPPELHYEPRLALDGGAEGLDSITHIIRESPRYLRPQGILSLEIGADHGKRVRELLAQSGAFSEIKILQDLSGHERFAQAKRGL